MRPVCAGGCCLKRVEAGLNCLMFAIYHARESKMILLCVGVFHISYGAGGLSDIAGNAFIALRADSRRPIDRSRRANLLCPFRTHLGEVVRPNEGSPGAI